MYSFLASFALWAICLQSSIDLDFHRFKLTEILQHSQLAR